MKPAFVIEVVEIWMIFILLDYLTGIGAFYGSALIRSPALPTAVGLFCIACGIVLRIGTFPAVSTPRPLRHLLIVLGGATVAPLVLFGAYAGARLANAQLDQIREELMSQARILSAELSARLKRNWGWLVRRRCDRATSPSSSAKLRPR
jgi:hypothetical protein